MPGFTDLIGREAVKLYRSLGVMPSVLWKETPHQLWAMLVPKTAAAAVDVPMNSAYGLAKVNAMRAKKGLPPVAGKAFSNVLTSVPDARPTCPGPATEGASGDSETRIRKTVDVRRFVNSGRGRLGPVGP